MVAGVDAHRFKNEPCPTDKEFWQGEEVRFLFPPGNPIFPPPGGAGWASPASDPGCLGLPPGAVVFTSSGSTGQPKWIVLTREALLVSARRVVKWLAITAEDHIFCPLPLFHVGGVGLLARARVSGAGFSRSEGKWDAHRFVASLRKSMATVTSLVPTQVYDLVRAKLKCPECLRIVVVGGGHLTPELESEARQLGWPVLASFGMTEAASQIATERPDFPSPAPGWLPVLEGWETSLAPDGRLRLRGEGTFVGTILGSEGSWRFEPAPLTDGWLTANDLVDLQERNGVTWLRPKGRSDDAIKIRGELVSLAKAEREVEGLARGHGIDPRSVALIDIADRRIGRLLVLVGEASTAESLPAIRTAFDRRAPSYARIGRVVELDELPRSSLGKLQREELRRRIMKAER